LTDFYTNFCIHKGHLLLRCVENGERNRYKIRIKPYLFLPTDKPSPYKTLDGKFVFKREFDNLHEARTFVKEHDGVAGFKYYGMTNHAYPFINDTYPGHVDYDEDKIVTAYIDIENEHSLDTTNTPVPITAITLYVQNIYHVFGFGNPKTGQNYEPHLDNVVYYKAKDERDMLFKFLDVWQSIAPDVISGWNIDYFDLPYLINRMTLILGADEAVKLSPWGVIEPKIIEQKLSKREILTFLIYGVNILDYQHLYKKFSFKEQENYKLNTIANIVLGEKKLDYSEYENLQDLYNKNYQLFMEYNIQDTGLVKRIDDKERILSQVFALAYDGKVSFNDTLTTVNMWDVIIHNYLLDQGIVVPQKTPPSVNMSSLPGGYNKEPNPGLYRWVMNYDLTSLYPMLIQQYNISPEKLSGKLPLIYPSEWSLSEQYRHVSSVINGAVTKYGPEMQSTNHCVAASGYTFSKDEQGFIPALMARLFADRAEAKGKMLNAKKQFEATKDKKWEAEISRWHNFQLAKKIQLNSCYGALGNPYFRWFDMRLAESITLSGQLSIRWVEKYLNKYMNAILGTTDKDYVIAIDTDSVYLTFGEVVDQYMPGLPDLEVVDALDKFSKEKVIPVINKAYRDLAKMMNAFENKMEMKRENIANKGLWMAKKRYILNVWDSEGVRYDKPHLKITGLEAVRSSVPSVCREAIKHTYGLIMNENEAAVQKYLADFKEKFYNLSFEDVAWPRGVNGLEKYKNVTKSVPIHVRGSIIYNKAIQDAKLQDKFPLILDGDKIRFCYLKLPNPVKENVIACSDTLPRQLGLDRYIDYSTQYSKAFMESIKSMLDVIGWQAEKRNTIDMFFKD